MKNAFSHCEWNSNVKESLFLGFFERKICHLFSLIDSALDVKAIGHEFNPFLMHWPFCIFSKRIFLKDYFMARKYRPTRSQLSSFGNIGRKWWTQDPIWMRRSFRFKKKRTLKISDSDVCTIHNYQTPEIHGHCVRK